MVDCSHSYCRLSFETNISFISKHIRFRLSSDHNLNTQHFSFHNHQLQSTPCHATETTKAAYRAPRQHPPPSRGLLPFPFPFPIPWHQPHQQTSIVSSHFNRIPNYGIVLELTTMAVAATSVAKLQREGDKKDSAIEDYYEKLAKYEARIAELENELATAKKAGRDSEQQCKTLKKDLDGTKTSLEKHKQAIKNTIAEKNTFKIANNNYIEDAKSNDKTIEEQKITIQKQTGDFQKILEKAHKEQDRVHQRNFALEKANTSLISELDVAKQELNAAQLALQDLFDQDQNVKLDDLLSMGRSMKQRGSFSTTNNHASSDAGTDDDADDDGAANERTPRKPRNKGSRLVSGASLQNELEEAGWDSSTEHDDEEKSGLTGLLEDTPAAQPPPQQTPGFSFTFGAPPTAAPIAPPPRLSLSNIHTTISQEPQTAQQPPQQKLDFSDIITQATSPIAVPTVPSPNLALSSITSVETRPIAPPPPPKLSLSTIQTIFEREPIPSPPGNPPSPGLGPQRGQTYEQWMREWMMERRRRDASERERKLQKENNELTLELHNMTPRRSPVLQIEQLTQTDPIDLPRTCYIRRYIVRDEPIIKTVYRTVLQDVKYVPAWWKVFGFLALLVLAMMFSALVGERKMWSEANDMARVRTVNVGLSGASNWNPLVSVFGVVESYVGGPHRLPG